MRILGNTGVLFADSSPCLGISGGLQNANGDPRDGHGGASDSEDETASSNNGGGVPHVTAGRVKSRIAKRAASLDHPAVAAKRLRQGPDGAA